MYNTDWAENDGYHECLVSLRQGCTPIFRARAVLTSDGSYAAVVREYKGKGLLLSYVHNPADHKYRVLTYAKNQAMKQVEIILKSALNNTF